MLGILGLFTGCVAVTEAHKTNQKAKEQRPLSAVTVMERQQRFDDWKRIQSVDYAPHLKKAVPAWKKGR